MEIQNNIQLPLLHPTQYEVINNNRRFNVLNCGRRWGKNILIQDLITKAVLKGKLVAHLEPSYKMTSDMFRDMIRILKPAITRSDKSENRIELNTGGCIDFWSLENFDAIRGRKYHLVIINEAAMFRNLKDAFEYVIRPTLADYKGEIWFCSTPKGENYFKELYDKGLRTSAWKSFCFTSYDNPKLDPEEINIAKEDLPEVIFNQEYLAKFISGAGTYVSRKDLKYFNLSDINLDILDITVGVDLAISTKKAADYTALVVLGRNTTNGNIYVLDVIRDKLNFSNTINLIEQVSNKWKAGLVGIESTAYQVAAVQELIRQTTLNVKAVYPNKDKITRFQGVAARYQHGLIYHNKDLFPEFEKELLGFPLVEHDDMCDAIVHAYSLLSEKKEASFIF